MMKRIIALLLALILTVGLLPTVALAAEGDTPAAGTSSDVKNGYYEGTTWKEGTLEQGTLPAGVVSVSKTAEKVEGEENKYEVTLEVVLKKTESQENPGSAATVLVLDHSGSMNGCAYCKSTTDDGVNYYHTQGCKYDKPHQWVRVTSEQSRMSAATKAVKDFIKTYSGRFDENGQETTIADLNLGRWVCLVWFNKKGGVTGGGDWVDVSNKSGYQTATNTNGWKAHDGTNLDCGLRLADHWLKQSPVASINKSLKNVIVLSDGEPTFYLSKGVSIKGSIKIGNTTYYVHGSGKDCKKDTYNTTKITAATLRNSASVYTVCFGASGNEIKDYDKNGNQKITVGNYLKQKIATQPKTGSQETFAYDAANADALNKAFAAITNTIVSGLSTGTVKDTLPTGITSEAFGKDKVKEWKLNEAPFTKNETPNTVGGTQVTTYTYTYTYTVTIDPEKASLVEVGGVDYAPLNGETTLTVKNSQGTDVEIPFPIPAGKVTMPSHKVTYKIDGEQYGDVDTVEFGTEVTVRENPTKTGYSFSGWSTTDATVTDGKFTMPDKDVTLTGSWTQTQVPVDLSQYIQKSLVVEEGSNLPDNYEETFTFDVFIDDAEGPQSFSVTMAEAGTNYVDKTGTISLTVGLHTFTVREAVPTTKTLGMTYDTTEKTFALMVNADGTYTFGHVNEGEFAAEQNEADRVVIFTNTYTEPKEPSVVSKTVVTTDMVDTLPPSVSSDIEAFKNKVDILYPVVNGEASTLEVPYGTKSVTLLYKITVNAGTKTSMQFEDVGAERVSVFDDDNVDVSQVGRTFTVRFYRGVTTADIYVAKTYKNLVFDSNGECTVENVISEEIKATTTVTEKDPNKLTINFADYVQKELAATGTKTASDVDFTVDVKGKEQTMIIASAEGEEAISTYADEFDPKYSRTLTAHFDSITGGEVKTTRFTGTTVEIDHAGHYTFFLGEEKGTRTGVTYDEARYTLYINVRLDQNENKLYVSSMGAIRTNSDGTWENIALIEMENDEPVRTTNYITFHNTIDTGKDDYYPIIIPTIINKDTGMLNKTDHFAYVIGYPDGTVHPNGQITRAEVATIFFRLLRDEVRDGAFTTSNTYSDVAYGKWYNNPISTMSALGIITGYPDGTFKPNKPITRAEFAAIAARFDETQSGKSATFSDVIGHWAAKEIGIAYYNDWIKGYPDGTFKPDQNITRAEAMTMINRVLERKPESPADLLTNMNKWTDNMDTSKWYYLDVQEATNSHGYTRKTFNYELWRQMLNDPDWSRYER